MGRPLPCFAQPNVGSMPSQTSNLGGMRRSWHLDPDLYAVRQYIIEKILQGFHRRQISPEWQQRLPDFVRRLEEGLFNEATSKEEYMDLTTLDRRLQIVVKRVPPPNNRIQNLGHQNSSGGAMIPTPGLQQNGNASSMIPTPGTDTTTANGLGTGNLVTNTVGMGNMMQNSSDNIGLIHGNSMPASDNN